MKGLQQSERPRTKRENVVDTFLLVEKSIIEEQKNYKNYFFSFFKFSSSESASASRVFLTENNS